MDLPFSYVVSLSFGGFLLSDVHTGIAAYFPFLSFALVLVGVGFGLGVRDDLGTSANTYATSQAAPSTSQPLAHPPRLSLLRSP